MNRPQFCFAFLFIASPIWTSWAHGAVFEGLGFMTEETQSVTSAVSADGAWIVGTSVPKAGGWPAAYRWSARSGIEQLTPLPNYSGSFALGISANGSVIVGRSSSDDSLAVTWVEDNSAVSLGTLALGSSASDVSLDGSVITGTTRLFDLGGEAFRWTAEGGMVGLGFLDVADDNDSPTSFGTAVSADGSFIVGHSNGLAFRWDEVSGMSSLGWLPHPSGHEIRRSEASAVSADGEVVVGTSNNQAFRWTESTGMVALSPPAVGDEFTHANDVSADGSLIVGQAVNGSVGIAFLWDAENGIRSLSNLLAAEYSLELAGWELIAATSISANGRVIVGNGRNPLGHAEAWRAVLAQNGDTNEDGRVDVTDLNNVRNGFAGAGPDDGTVPGDAFPFDGRVDIDDLNAVRNNFGAGAATVPELSAVTLAGLLAVLAVIFHRGYAPRSVYTQSNST